jgi:hypothetical protein
MAKDYNKVIIAVDFDGTVVTHEYPNMGSPIRGAIHTLKHIVREGHQLILWTMRDGKELDAAVKYFSDNSITLFGINSNPDQSSWTNSPKAYANLYIDDAALGCPTSFHTDSGRVAVDWYEVNYWLYQANIIKHPKMMDGTWGLDRSTYFEELYPPLDVLP